MLRVVAKKVIGGEWGQLEAGARVVASACRTSLELIFRPQTADDIRQSQFETTTHPNTNPDDSHNEVVSAPTALYNCIATEWATAKCLARQDAS
jgi:hypothetical protein